MIIVDIEQGSDDWLEARLGIPTMSRAKDMIANGRGNQPSKTTESYILELVSERMSGLPANDFVSYHMARGTFMEQYALQAVEAALTRTFERPGFVLTDDERIGCSPDAMGLEIKSPAPKQHIRNIVANGKEDYIAQIQGCMWICEQDKWLFASFCPDVQLNPLYIATIYRDEKMIAKIRESAYRVADEVDSLCSEIPQVLDGGILRKAREARQAWMDAQATETEVVL